MIKLLRSKLEFKKVNQLVYQQAVSELRSFAYKLYGLVLEGIEIVEENTK